MKTIRLLYPDYVSGGLETYYLGAKLMAQILPENDKQPLMKVEILPPDGQDKEVKDGIYGKEDVLSGIQNAMNIIESENPDKIITIGGNCMVSLAAFDYLHGKYKNVGILWLDAHPDVSTIQDGYPCAHAMVLGSLMGDGDESLSGMMKNPKFKSDQIMYVGLQQIHDYQKKYLDEAGVDYRVQTDSFVSEKEIKQFIDRFDHVLVHFDIDILDPALFHSTYYADPDAVGDGAGGGRMTLMELADILKFISRNADIVGFTVAEYLPFEAQKLNKMFSEISLFME